MAWGAAQRTSRSANPADDPFGQWRNLVERRGQSLSPLDQSGSGPDHDCIGVDRPHGHLGGKAVEHGSGLLGGTLQVVPAGGDHHVLWCGRRDVVPRDRNRLLAGSGENRFGAGRLHHIGYPMATEERRVDPFQDEHPRASLSGHLRREAGEPLVEGSHEIVAAVAHSGRLGHGEHRCDDLVEGLRIDLENLRSAVQTGDRFVDVTTRNRAHAAQVLTQDQIGIATRQRVFVEAVQLVATGEALANQVVDLQRCEVLGVHATHHDLSTNTGLGRKVAFERDAEKVVGQSEFEHDLGGRREQRHDAHARSVGHLARCGMAGSSSSWQQLSAGVELPFDPLLSVPTMHEVRLTVPSPDPVADVEKAVHDAVLSRLAADVTKGMSVAVGGGSRGLSQRVEMLRGAVSGLRALGAEPFVVPAMGSHGGATADGQIAMLHSLGMTEESLGAEIRATMKTVEVARTAGGMPIYLDENAAAADRILPVNRMKPHTCFKGPIESGCTKMAVVGFGKQPGAAQIHSCGPEEMRERLYAGITALRATGRLLGGVASVESASGEVVRIAGLTATDVGGPLETELAELARTLVPPLPFDEIDVLIVERAGKDISGTGMDPNVTGRFWVHGLADPEKPRIATIVLLDITDVSAGNLLGIGLADFIPVRLAEKIDWQKTYVNCFTAGPSGVRRSRMPMVLADDDACIKAALSMCGRAVTEPKRVVRIKSTLHLTKCWVSDALLSELPPGATVTSRAT